jgi:hypothetical protein
MEGLTPVAWIVYVIFCVYALFIPGTVKVNDVPVQNPVTRVAVTIIIFPILGLLFYAMGFIGKFMLLPFQSLL